MIYPLFAMVILTFVIMFLLGYSRVSAVRKKTVSHRYFKLMRGYEIPDNLVQVERHYANLFEMPILFYAAGILYLCMDMHSTVTVLLAWCFVVGRVIHAFIHLTYNHPLHRLAIFATSNLCILAIWINILLYINR